MTIEILELNQDQESGYFQYLALIIYPFYVLTIVMLTFLISVNQKRFRKKFKFDSLFMFMGIYLGNFIFTSLYFRSLNHYVRVGLPTILMLVIIWACSKAQLIGITGGISCGKSTVTNYFKNNFNIPIIDCDVLARVVVEPGKPAYKKIVKYFGNEILLPDKTIDRKQLGTIVFNNSAKRKYLTSVTGRYILFEIVKEYFRLTFKKNEKFIILDAPLLFETKILEHFCYPNIVVYISNEETVVSRLMERDCITKEQALAKIGSQMSTEAKKKKADVLIQNDGTLQQLVQNISKILIHLYA